MSTEARRELERRARRGAAWFHAIALVSLAGSALHLAGVPAASALSLGLSRFCDTAALGLLDETGGAILAVALGLDLIAVSAVAAFGVLARRGRVDAYRVGTLLYLLDGVLLVVTGGWLGVAVHGVVLFGLWNDLRDAEASAEPASRAAAA